MKCNYAEADLESTGTQHLFSAFSNESSILTEGDDEVSPDTFGNQQGNLYKAESGVNEYSVKGISCRERCLSGTDNNPTMRRVLCSLIVTRHHFVGMP